MVLIAIMMVIISIGVLLLNRDKAQMIIPMIFVSISLITVVSIIYATKVSEYQFLVQLDYELYLMIKKLQMNLLDVSKLFDSLIVAYLFLLALFMVRTKLINRVVFVLLILSEVLFYVLSDASIVHNLYIHSYFADSNDVYTLIYDKRNYLIDGIFYLHMIVPIAMTVIRAFFSRIFYVKQKMFYQCIVITAANLYMYLAYFHMYFKSIWITNVNVSKIPNVGSGNILDVLISSFVLFCILVIWFILIARKLKRTFHGKFHSDEMFVKNFGSQLHMYKNSLITIGQQFNLIKIMQNNLNDDVCDVVEKGIIMTDKTIKDIENVITLLKRSSVKKIPVNLIELIEIAEKNCVDGTITVNKFYSDKEAIILGDEDRLIEAFVNLFKNSIEASADERKLTIDISIICENGYYMMSYRDNGEGIEQKYIKHIFASFFTTKSRVGGIGLTYVKDVVQQHDGKIIADSKKGEYTRFKLVFPKY